MYVSQYAWLMCTHLSSSSRLEVRQLCLEKLVAGQEVCQPVACLRQHSAFAVPSPPQLGDQRAQVVKPLFYQVSAFLLGEDVVCTFLFFGQIFSYRFDSGAVSGRRRAF